MSPWLVVIGIVAVGILVGLVAFRPARKRRQGSAADEAAGHTVGDQVRQDRSGSYDYGGDSGGGGGGGD